MGPHITEAIFDASSVASGCCLVEKVIRRRMVAPQNVKTRNGYKSHLYSTVRRKHINDKAEHTHR